jgi:hypothetical protein
LLILNLFLKQFIQFLNKAIIIALPFHNNLLEEKREYNEY